VSGMQRRGHASHGKGVFEAPCRRLGGLEVGGKQPQTTQLRTRVAFLLVFPVLAGPLLPSLLACWLVPPGC